MALQPDAAPSNWKLDVTAPDEPGTWPIVVFTRGVGSGKENYVTYNRAIAERGAVVFTMDWPTRYPTYAINDNGKGFREILETLACAIRFARARASDFGGDPERIILVGYSLGGGAGAQVALLGDEADRLWKEFASLRGGPPPQVDCAVSGFSAHVDAFVGIAGTYGTFVGTNGWYGREWLQAEDPELWEMFYSSLGQNQDLIIRLIHGEGDQEIPFENSAEFAALLAEAGYDVVLTPFDSELHYVPLELTVETVMEVARD
jgi:acetyl esterase/lipase